MFDEEQMVIKIAGLPRKLSVRKLSFILNRFSRTWQLEDLIPLEEYLVAIITCDNEDAYESFLKLTALPRFTNYPNLRIYKESSTLSQPSHQQGQNISTTAASTINLSQLNCNCLRQIFEKCALQSQITLAKVCHCFHAHIRDIWRQRYTTLLFSLHHFKMLHNLSEEELWDFCLIIGPHVQRLIFNSVLFFPVSQSFMVNQPWNMMKNAKRYINVILCRHLMHFTHLRVCEVQGKFLAEYTVRELARYCPELRELRLLDAGTRWLVGAYFHRLRRLEVLHLQDCDNLYRRLMRKTCRSLPNLRDLNIVKCRELMHAPTIRQLCTHFQHSCALQQLHLSAAADAKMLAALLALPQLRVLKFYWLNDCPQFERLLFSELLRQRSQTLRALHFENEPAFLENASQRVWRAGEYAAMRETVVINSRPWLWHECFDEWLSLLSGGLEQFVELNFVYCRILTHEQILEMPRIATNLKAIRFIGCRQAEDEKLMKAWRLEDIWSCELRMEGELDWCAVQSLKDRVMPYRKAGNWQPIYRSIKCQFNESSNTPI